MRSVIVLLLLLIAIPTVVQGQRSLAGTDWRLISLGPAGAETDVVAATTVTAKFGEDGRVSGSTGCNSYSGTYEVRGDAIVFGRLISTRRACLDQNANEQERRFLAALEAANRFRLSTDRLTIFADRTRTVLNFVRTSSSEPDDGPRDERNDPVAALASYFNAINARDYRRAYGYYETPPYSYEQFARGFADTDSVRFLVEPPRTEGAAGSIYAAIPTVIVSTLRGGNERVFAGCYVMRRSNVRDRGWQIYRTEVSQFPASSRISRLLSQRCR